MRSGAAAAMTSGTRLTVLPDHLLGSKASGAMTSGTSLKTLPRRVGSNLLPSMDMTLELASDITLELAPEGKEEHNVSHHTRQQHIIHSLRDTYYITRVKQFIKVELPVTGQYKLGANYF